MFQFLKCFLFVAGLIIRQPQAEFSGQVALLSCGRDPVGPVKWTWQHSPDSPVKDIDNNERFHLRGCSVIIHNVESTDSGIYNCSDTAGELRAIELAVIGKCRD